MQPVQPVGTQQALGHHEPGRTADVRPEGMRDPQIGAVAPYGCSPGTSNTARPPCSDAALWHDDPTTMGMAPRNIHSCIREMNLTAGGFKGSMQRLGPF